MSSNRLSYDKCAYATEMKESTGPLEYNLFKGKYENSIECPVSDFTNILGFGTRADVESELYGINRTSSLCPSLKYNPDNKFKTVNFSPARTCDSIHFITPNNIEKPKTNMLNYDKIDFN